MPGYENRNVLAAALSAFTGPLPPGYAGEREFYLTTLLGMGGVLCDLQREALKDVCDRFLALVAAGKATPRAVEAFRSELARARRAVGEYCAAYRVSVSPEATLTPFSLHCVDAALAASYQFYRDIMKPAWK